MKNEDRSCHTCRYRKYNEKLSDAGLVKSMSVVCTKTHPSMLITDANIAQCCAEYKVYSYWGNIVQTVATLIGDALEEVFEGVREE